MLPAALRGGTRRNGCFAAVGYLPELVGEDVSGHTDGHDHYYDTVTGIFSKSKNAAVLAREV